MSAAPEAGKAANRAPDPKPARDAAATGWSLFRSGGLASIAAASLFLLTLVIAYDVVARYFLGAPTRWAFEVSKYLMATMVMFGAAHAMAVGAHIRVEVLYDLLPPRARLYCDVLAALAGFLFCSILTWQSALFAWRSWVQDSHSLDLNVPMYLPQALVPFGSAILAIECLIATSAALRRLRHS